MANDGPAAKTDISADGTLEMPAADRGRDPDLPHSFGKFVIDSRLGQGGMGIVFAGHDADLGRPVAIKVLRPELGHLRERLLREARAMARVEHPNVVRVYEVGTDAANVFVAMELIEGTTLEEWLRPPRGWEQIVAMFRQVGEGLRAVHRADLVHRDFKPQNVLVDRAGFARVADFGLVRHESDDASPLGATLTQTGAMMGTPGYMAPEQQFGGDVDARADQYSFCVALREALGGRPFDEARWRLVPATVRDAIGRGLAFDATERWPTLDDLLGALADLPPDTTVAMPTVESPRPRRRVGLVIAVAAVGVVGVAAAAIALATRGSSNSEQPVVAPAVAAIAPTQDAGVAPTAVVLPPVAAIDGGVAAVEPEGKVHDRARLALIRKTVHDLGYEGIDLARLDAAPDLVRHTLDQKLATAHGADAAIARVQLGMTLRRHGDCSAAVAAWKQTIPGLARHGATAIWASRAHTGLSLCALERGDVATSNDEAQAGWGLGDGDDPELHLISAIDTYELDGENHAASFVDDIMQSDRFPRVKKLTELWLAGVGWKWTDQVGELQDKIRREDAEKKAAKTAAANADAGVDRDAGASETPFVVPPLPAPVPRVIPPKLPAATVGDPGHLPVLRATIRDLGYLGVLVAAIDKDPEDSQRDAEQRVATYPPGMPQAAARYDLAMIQRRRGDCAHALASWTEALEVFDHDKLGAGLAARSRFGIALCDLADGNGYAAKDMLARAWNDGDRAQIKLAMALAAYERGERPVAQSLMITADHDGGMNVNAAIKTWLAGTGLTLMP